MNKGREKENERICEELELHKDGARQKTRMIKKERKHEIENSKKRRMLE
jgi:hypothetical protein